MAKKTDKPNTKPAAEAKGNVISLDQLKSLVFDDRKVFFMFDDGAVRGEYVLRVVAKPKGKTAIPMSNIQKLRIKDGKLTFRLEAHFSPWKRGQYYLFPC